MKDFTENEISMMSDRELVVEYLRRYAEENPDFKAKMEDKSHTIDGLMTYLRKCAMESITSDGKMAMAWHTRVFGWARAYYLKPANDAKKDVKKSTTTTTKKEKPATTDAKDETKAKKDDSSKKDEKKKDAPIVSIDSVKKKEEKKPAVKVTKKANDIYQLDLSLFD